MVIIDIEKQLQFRRLMSQIQEISKLNFASLLKMRIFATSFNRKERPRESAFSLDSANGELGHFTNMMQELEKMDACLNCIRIHYDTASGVIHNPYLHHSKGVQAQPFGIG